MEALFYAEMKEIVKRGYFVQINDKVFRDR